MLRDRQTDRETDRWTPDRFIDPAPVTLLLLLNAWMSDTCSGTDRQTDGQTPDHFIDPAVHTTRRTVVVLLVVRNKTEGIRQSSYIHRA